MSALQISRMLGITYKSVWFMCHRIREQMTPARRSPIVGQRRTVESDETVIGGKAKNRAYAKKPPKKVAVLTLVDRDGDSHSFHVANVKAKTLREAIVCVVVDRKHTSANAGERRPPSDRCPATQAAPLRELRMTGHIDIPRSRHDPKILWVESLRPPQADSLDILADILDRMTFEKARPVVSAAEGLRSEEIAVMEAGGT